MSLFFEYGAKKSSIPIKPNNTIAEALVQFCKKYGLPEDNWTATNVRKEIDLSLTFRLSGLSTNAKISLTRKISTNVKEVNVALQIPSGDRLINKFPPTISLWEILKYWEKGKNINLCSDGDIPPNSPDKVKVYMQPVITYTTKEIGTNTELRSTTLVKLGLTSGSGLLRLLHKFTTIPLDQFLKIDLEKEAQETMSQEREAQILKEKREIEQKEFAERARIERERTEAFKKQAEEEQKKMAERVKQYIKEEEELKKHQSEVEKYLMERKLKEDEKAKMEIDLLIQKEREEAFRKLQVQKKLDLIRESNKRQKVETIQIPDRNPEVFAPSSTPFDPSTINIPDDFYDITMEDIKLNAQIIKERKKEEEIEKSVLRTKEMREKLKSKKWEKFKKCFIRIRFPDRTELQAIFGPLEKPAAIYDFLKSCLREENSTNNFYIYTIPPKTILKYDNPSNFRELSFLPAAIVHFGVPEESKMVSPFLKDELIKDIKEKLNPPEVYIPKTDQISIISSFIERNEEKPTTDDREKMTTSSEKTGKTVPSWFDKGKKK